MKTYDVFLCHSTPPPRKAALIWQRRRPSPTRRAAATYSPTSTCPILNRNRDIKARDLTQVQAFMRKDYRRYGGQSRALAPLPTAPRDYDAHLRRLRRRLRLTQDDLARRIGAANKAVVYQWESRKRAPSPVFWQRVEALDGARPKPPHPTSSLMESSQNVSTSSLAPQDGADASVLGHRICCP